MSTDPAMRQGLHFSWQHLFSGRVPPSCLPKEQSEQEPQPDAGAQSSCESEKNASQKNEKHVVLPTQPKPVLPDKTAPPWALKPDLMQNRLEHQPFRDNPAAHYIVSFKSSEQRGAIYRRLRSIAVFLSDDPYAKPESYPWWTIRQDGALKVHQWAIRKYKNPHSARNIISALRNVLHYCVGAGMMSADDRAIAVFRLKMPTAPPSPRGRCLPQSEIVALFDAIDSCSCPPKRYRDAALFTVAFFQGLRRSELRGLNIKDVDFEYDSLSVYGKGARHDLLPLHKATRFALKRWLRLYDIDCKLPKSSPLFVSVKTSNWRQRLIRLPKYELERLTHFWAKEAGIKDLCWHDARRTNASAMFDAGVEPLSASKLLRHRDYHSTKIYDRRDGTNLATEAAKLAFGSTIEAQAQSAEQLRAQMDASIHSAQEAIGPIVPFDSGCTELGPLIAQQLARVCRDIDALYRCAYDVARSPTSADNSSHKGDR